MATTKTKKPAHGSKSDFVRGLPKDMPAKDVVAKAAEKGIKLAEKYVYVVRSAAKAKGNKANGTKPAQKRGAARASAASASQRARGGEQLEAMLRQSIADCGLVRSREIFDEVAAAFGG